MYICLYICIKDKNDSEMYSVLFFFPTNYHSGIMCNLGEPSKANFFQFSLSFTENTGLFFFKILF